MFVGREHCRSNLANKFINNENENWRKIIYYM
jgi:hypothetical protein